MSHEEIEFDRAYRHWQHLIQQRPESGVYAGKYCDYIERSVLKDGKFHKFSEKVSDDDQAEDYKAWRVYVYAREKLLEKYTRAKFD